MFDRRFLPLLIPALFALTVTPAAAQRFGATNVQVLHGTGFSDWYYGNRTVTERMTTVTFEHLSGFGPGTLFFFADYAHATFVDPSDRPTGTDQRIYSEATLRVSPLRLAGADTWQGLVRDVALAVSTEQGSDGYEAYLAGAGVDLSLPFLAVSTVDVYYRNDDFNDGTWQVTGVWAAPFKVGRTTLSFGGFVDVHGTDRDGVDFHTQPQFLVGLDGVPVSAGVELVYHRNERVDVLAPQVMLKWSL